MQKLIYFLIVAAVAGCKPWTHRAKIDVEEGVTVALTIRPMFGWHSDWYRKLLIETPAGSLGSDLFEDTGWWRGSNLYRHSSGVYVLHEGQAGCVFFRVSPLQFVSVPAISCEKNDQITEAVTDPAGNASPRFPASRFYRDFRYIGQFVETPQGQDAISFIGVDEKPEAELPDIL